MLMIFRTRPGFARAAALLAACGIVLGLGVLAAQRPTTPGQITARPDEGREPEFPQPKIRDYKPPSTLVVPQHPVPRAKFPVVDIHGHPPALTSSSVIDTVVAALNPI